ncbi:sigma-54-dependent Fis family transcriptional regulator [candidate division KSB1 bacterium]|nr:sigma-54-dependent Fis family transcriptional regulator [candidate division KSB1 bacterium]
MIDNARILVIDDEKDMLNACHKILTAFGHSPVVTDSGHLAITYLEQEEFDLILCDLCMPDVDGIAILKKANELAPSTPVVIFTAYGTVDRAVNAMKMGAFDFLEKPFEVEHLEVLVKKGLHQRMLYKERGNLLSQLEDKFSFENIVGRSSIMQKVFEMVESVAPTDANIFISGESGTGKELIARSIHTRSRCRTKPFIPVNCGALPENLFEAELFGYEKGAFTGAVQRKPGLLEYADGGTFFLDEVCELSEPLQVKLLRVLQDMQLRHIGGNELIKVNIRLISASNRDLEQAKEHGILRPDFYYRLNVINIHIPPLRERREDIRVLAEYFLRQQLKSSEKEISGIHPLVAELFDKYDWPGNVRELENVMEHAITLCRGDEIVLADLPANLLKDTTKNNNGNESYTTLSLSELKQKKIEEVEKDYLLALLKECKGNVTHMAQKAQMTRRNIHRLFIRHHIDPSVWRTTK